MSAGDSTAPGTTGELEAGQLATAERLAREVLDAHAAHVDTENRFPEESVRSLHAAGLLSIMARTDAAPARFAQLARVAAALGEGCLSTALVWAMHNQQVAVLSRHGSGRVRERLARALSEGGLVASVTTESGPSGADLFASHAPLSDERGRVRVRRSAPAVSYGEQASLFLVKMRAAADRPAGDVRLVLASRADGETAVTGDWQALGMRGTRTVPMEFDLLVDRDMVLAEPFREIALRTMVPAGHLGWAGAWHGAARRALRDYVDANRGSKAAVLRSEDVRAALADARLSLDLVGALIERVAVRLDALDAAGAGFDAYAAPRHQIELNEVKVAASELCMRVVDSVLELTGFRGYRRDVVPALERTFRDLRSASLMFSNARLRQANARLMVVEDRG